MIFEDTVLLLRYNCPDEDCDVACLGWPDLHRHVKSKHNKMMWYVERRVQATLELSADLASTAIYALVTKRSLHTSMNYLRLLSYENTKSLATTSLVL